MARKNIRRIKSGLKQALEGARAELDDRLTKFSDKVDRLADDIATDDDLKKIVSGVRSLLQRTAQSIADVLKKGQSDPKKEERPPGA